MKKYIISGILISILILSVTFAVAKEKEKAFKLPKNAVKVAPNVYKLGTAKDKGKIVEGYAIIHYKKGFGKPGAVCGNNVCEKGENARKCPADCSGGTTDPDTSGCYGFLSKGAKWKTTEPYIVDPTNTEGLSETFITSTVAADIGKWETAAGKDILGDEIAGVVDGADTVSTDGKNEVMFGSIASEGAIAVTIVWGIFGGNPRNRELVEWDMIFDEVDFDWGIADPNKMDFENIAIHELGHSVGLDDLYTTECSEQTMYGYATEGETKKSTLESGDITGIRKLY